MKPYQPVPPHVRERLEISVLTGERLDLQWADETSDRAFLARVEPRAVIEENGALYLLGQTAQGEDVRIRLDLIRNLPTPVK